LFPVAPITINPLLATMNNQRAFPAGGKEGGGEGEGHTSTSSTKDNINNTKDAHTATSNMSMSVLNGILHGVVWVILSLNIPFLLSRRDATEILHTAYYKYSTELSFFDNTIWTYGTDYGLATTMTFLAYWILQSAHGDMKRLCNLSASLMILYAISTLAGGLAHHNFFTVESRNTAIFRVLWTTCVGTVCLASVSMGMIGNECLQLFRNRSDCSPILKSMPLISDTYWIIYGLVVTIACGLGMISFQRPACDIFIAGTTQAPSTFYCMAFLYAVNHNKISYQSRIMGIIGFILNAALLPIFPVLVLHLGWSLPSVNTFLHSVLFMAWSMQGIILQRVIRALVEDQHQQQVEEKELKSVRNMKKVQ